MDLLSKLSFAKKESSSWAVILKGIPDKRSEENLIHLFTERLNIPGDDALRIIRSLPIILFDERNSREAEQIKLALNKTGVRTSISNDLDELKKLPRVVWPRKIEAPELHLPQVYPLSSQASFKPLKPVAPSDPKPAQMLRPAERIVPTPSSPPSSPSLPPPPASDEWKIKYQNLQESYLNAMDRLKKKEAELKTALDRSKKLEQDSSSLYTQLERFRKERIEEKVSELEIKLKVVAEERDLAAAERDETRRRLELQDKELAEIRASRTLLEKEKETLKAEKEEVLRACQEAEKGADSLRREIAQHLEAKEKLSLEIEKVKVDLESYFDSLRSQSEAVNAQINRLERLLEALRGGMKVSVSNLPESITVAEVPPPPKPQTRALHIGIAPPPPRT